MTELCRRAGAGEKKTLLAREFGICRETLYQYLRQGTVNKPSLEKAEPHLAPAGA